MKFIFSMLVVSWLMACTGMPAVLSAPDIDREMIIKKSRDLFLKERWRLVHSINGKLPGGGNASMIGVSVASPEDGGIRCTLMSIEGFVFLDASYDGKLAVNRGIGPFKSEDLVMGMIRDIKLILFPPRGVVSETGSFRDGSSICRYLSDEGVTDVVIKDDGTAEIHVFDKDLNRIRFVVLGRQGSNGIPARIELKGYGQYQYALEIDLIEAEPVR
jgi:hypothetical protein